MRDLLRTLLDAAYSDLQPWPELFERDDHLQGAAAERERGSTLVRNFQPTIIPGLLQPSRNARAVLELGTTIDVDAAMVGRFARQEAMSELGRRFEFLISEAALQGRPSAEGCAGRADELARADGDGRGRGAADRVGAEAGVEQLSCSTPAASSSPP